MADKSTSSIGAAQDFETAATEITGKEVDLMDNIHGLEPTYRTVQRALPAYIGLEHVKYILPNWKRERMTHTMVLLFLTEPNYYDTESENK